MLDAYDLKMIEFLFSVIDVLRLYFQLTFFLVIFLSRKETLLLFIGQHKHLQRLLSLFCPLTQNR
jgi:hypothetical protein